MVLLAIGTICKTKREFSPKDRMVVAASWYGCIFWTWEVIPGNFVWQAEL